MNDNDTNDANTGSSTLPFSESVYNRGQHVGGASVSITDKRSETAAARSVTVTEADISPPRPGILAGVRTTTGGIPQGDVLPTHIINIPGLPPMRVAFAEAEGYVRRNAAGQYEEVPLQEYAASKRAA